CSLISSPLPNAADRRSGNICARVAIAWATIAGWYRWPGAVTTPTGNDVQAMAAPSQAYEQPDLPCQLAHGAKWSDDEAAWEPGLSAYWTSASSWRGLICSWEACQPTTGMPPPPRDRFGLTTVATARSPVRYP